MLGDVSAAAASGGIDPGDAAILRSLSALEILEADSSQQYNELTGIWDREVPGGSGNRAFTPSSRVSGAQQIPRLTN